MTKEVKVMTSKKCFKKVFFQLFTCAFYPVHNNVFPTK